MRLRAPCSLASRPDRPLEPSGAEPSRAEHVAGAGARRRADPERCSHGSGRSACFKRKRVVQKARCPEVSIQLSSQKKPSICTQPCHSPPTIAIAGSLPSTGSVLSPTRPSQNRAPRAAVRFLGRLLLVFKSLRSARRSSPGSRAPSWVRRSSSGFGGWVGGDGWGVGRVHILFVGRWDERKSVWFWWWEGLSERLSLNG